MSFSRKLKSELGEMKRLSKERAFVRSCFLDWGVVSNPERTYHLEFRGGDLHKLGEILAGFGLSPKKIVRKGREVLYIKGAEEIADCLKLMGAAKTALDFEELRVRKQVSNNVNRRVNFEAANLGKTANAASLQIEMLKAIDRDSGLSNLPKELEEVARIRLANENYTLEEIGAALEPKLSKSGVRHRMGKIKNYKRELDGHG